MHIIQGADLVVPKDQRARDKFYFFEFAFTVFVVFLIASIVHLQVIRAVYDVLIHFYIVLGDYCLDIARRDDIWDNFLFLSFCVMLDLGSFVLLLALVFINL